eukprot:1006887-Pelagomonas_calceolata.AAC.6
MVCSDTSASQSIISIKQDEDKLVPVDPTKLFGIAGEAGDRVNFTEFIIANVKLYELRNNTRLSTHAVAHLTRGELAKALRKGFFEHVQNHACECSSVQGHDFACAYACISRSLSWTERMHANEQIACAQSPYMCNLLLAGYDEKTGPSLYWMDYLATLNKINTGGTGYGAWLA